MRYKYTFTVFTPTYNRADTLHRVFESLRHQTFKDFQWVVVDDGSTDTTEALMAEYIAMDAFPIHYVKQENAGKHIAFNHGVRMAEGELFLSTDSDDEFYPQSLEVFKREWDAIEDKSAYCGVSALCICSLTGDVDGTRFPKDHFDSNSLENTYLHKITGDKWGFLRTDIIRQYPYPVIEGVKYVPESFAWTQIAHRYTTRYINIPLKLYYKNQPGSLSKGTGQHPKGMREWHLHNINTNHAFLIKAPVEYVLEHVRLAKQSLLIHQVWGSLQRLDRWTNRCLMLASLPLGWAMILRRRLLTQIAKTQHTANLTQHI